MIKVIAEVMKGESWETLARFEPLPEDAQEFFLALNRMYGIQVPYDSNVEMLLQVANLVVKDEGVTAPVEIVYWQYDNRQSIICNNIVPKSEANTNKRVLNQYNIPLVLKDEIIACGELYKLTEIPDGIIITIEIDAMLKMLQAGDDIRIIWWIEQTGT